MIPSPRLKGFLVIPLLIGLSGTAVGQTGPLQQRLAKATSLTCTFTLMTTGTWKGGTPSAEIAPAKVAVAFTNVSADDGTADSESRFGGSFVVVRYANDYLHLMQTHSAGPLYTTTVMAKETIDGRLMAVHTRHEYTDVRLPGFTSRPEMYFGDCAVVP